MNPAVARLSRDAAIRVAMACGAEVDSHELLLLPNGKGATLSVVFKEPPPPPPRKIKKGDLVRLKSGGPPLTVHAVRKDGAILCTWFDLSCETHTGIFTRGILEAIT